MPGVPRELAEHSLNVRPDAKPVKQPLRCFTEEKRKAIGEEIARLLAADFIMEVFYPDWLANPLLVLKKNNTWHMCIDYTSLNKACPKDPFALPRIDQVIDSTAGCDLLSFLDAYSGYHQILHYQSIAYGVYIAAKKLKHYFEEHPITVVSTTPLSEIIGCKDATGRAAKWAIELAAHTIQYKPRTTIKSQIIADFFADWGEHQYLPPAPDSTHWRMNFDGSKMLEGLGAAVVLTSPKEDKLQYVL
jgi:hypothetical protein